MLRHSLLATLTIVCLCQPSSSEAADLSDLKTDSPPPTEMAVIEQLRKALAIGQKATHPGLRGQHPKHHGCVWATLSVEGELQPEMQVGIFSEPRTYQALIRFSNGRAFQDTQPDVHGMAIKLFGVEGDKELADEKLTQDFVLADNPVFFARDAQHMLDFVVATSMGKTAAEMVATHPKLVGFTKAATDSPLSMQYWSQTPYRLGTRAVKYLAKPVTHSPIAVVADAGKDYLKDALVKQLASENEPARFDFMVQIQGDSVAMPLEDASVEWLSKPTKVATITIEPQKFDTPERQKFCEAVEFTPWHCLVVHKPLGSINRVRKPVYLDSLELRLSTNGIQHFEPTGNEGL